MITKMLKLKNSTTAYFDEGKGKGIVLLHGFCGSKDYWGKVIPALSEQYRVIAPDLPGHGNSSSIESNDTIDKIADHIKEIVDELKVQDVTLFGHSLGGYVALAFAEKYSERLEAFSLIHSTAFPDSDEAKKGRDASGEKIKDEDIGSFIDGLVPKLFSPENLEKNEEDVNTAKDIGYSTSPQGAIETLIAMKNRPDRNNVLTSTQLPVLLIAGEQDQIIPPEKTFSVSSDNIKQFLIKDSGHMSMYENPKDLITEIKVFMSSYN